MPAAARLRACIEERRGHAFNVHLGRPGTARQQLAHHDPDDIPAVRRVNRLLYEATAGTASAGEPPIGLAACWDASPGDGDELKMPRRFHAGLRLQSDGITAPALFGNRRTAFVKAAVRGVGEEGLQRRDSIQTHKIVRSEGRRPASLGRMAGGPALAGDQAEYRKQRNADPK